MYDGTSAGYMRISAGSFVRERFYSGKSLSECFDDFKAEYGRYGFEKGEPFNPLLAASLIRRRWYELKKTNYLRGGEGCVTLDALLDRPLNSSGDKPPSH
jgi:hypothetical protein